MLVKNIGEKWEDKRMHGKCPRSLDTRVVDKEKYY
jgi:hypothetical protein